jgi:hypothetical protein
VALLGLNPRPLRSKPFESATSGEPGSDPQAARQLNPTSDVSLGGPFGPQSFGELT